MLVYRAKSQVFLTICVFLECALEEQFGTASPRAAFVRLLLMNRPPRQPQAFVQTRRKSPLPAAVPVFLPSGAGVTPRHFGGQGDTGDAERKKGERRAQGRSLMGAEGHRH